MEKSEFALFKVFQTAQINVVQKEMSLKPNYPPPNYSGFSAQYRFT